MAREYVEKGGEKYRGFAQGRLRALTSLRRDLRLPTMRKQYKIADSHIWVKSSDYGDFIRITAGGKAHLVARTGLHTWAFFSWVNFALIEEFTVPDTAPYKGEGTQGTQLCAATADKLLVGTGSNTAGNAIYWLVSAVGEHDSIRDVDGNPYTRPGTDFYPVAGFTAAEEGYWVRATGDRFAHWGIGSHPGDTPFTGGGWWQTVVSSADLSTFSFVDSVLNDPDNEPASPYANQSFDTVDDNANSGMHMYLDGFDGSTIEFADPYVGEPKPDLSFVPAFGGTEIPLGGTPGRVWFVGGSPLQVRIASPGSLASLATTSLSPATTLHAAAVDIKQALIIVSQGASGAQAWHVVETADEAGAPVLTATDVSTVGAMSVVLTGAVNGHLQVGAWGGGIHLINRQF